MLTTTSYEYALEDTIVTMISYFNIQILLFKIHLDYKKNYSIGLAKKFIWIFP